MTILAEDVPVSMAGKEKLEVVDFVGDKEDSMSTYLSFFGDSEGHNIVLTLKTEYIELKLLLNQPLPA